MLQNVPCPSCGRTLAVDHQHLGTSVRCPICQTAFVAEAVADPAPTASEAITTSPAVPPALPPEPEDRSAAPDRAGPPPGPGREFADRLGIDVENTHHPAVSSKSEASRELERWKEEMPPV